MALGRKRRQQIEEIFRRQHEQDLLIESEGERSDLQTLSSPGRNDSFASSQLTFRWPPIQNLNLAPLETFWKLASNTSTPTASSVFLHHYRKPRWLHCSLSSFSVTFDLPANLSQFFTNHSSTHSSRSAISSLARSRLTHSQCFPNPCGTIGRVMVNWFYCIFESLMPDTVSSI